MLRVICFLAAILYVGLVAYAGEMVANPNDPKAWTFSAQAPAAGKLSADQGALRVDVTEASTDTYRIEMYRQGQSPVNGHTYLLTFSAKASQPRQIIVAGQLQEAPWTALTPYKTVRLDTNWQQYTIELTVNDSQPGKARFPTIQMAQATGTVWIRDLSLREQGEAATPAPAPATPTTQQPSGAEKSVEHMKPTNVPSNWLLEEHESSKATLKAEDNALRIDVTSRGTEHWHVQLYQHEKDIVPNKTYVMTFIAKASAPRKIGLTVQNDQSPYSPLIEDQSIELATVWQRYTIEFSPQNVVPKHTRMPVFQLGGEPGTVWLRDVSVTGPEGSAR